MKREVVQKMEKTNWSEEFGEGTSVRFDVPKELWVLVQQLYDKGFTVEDLFSRGGSHEDKLRIREALDMSECNDLSNTSVYSIAEALLVFLDALREPVIPYQFYMKCLKSSNNFVLCKQVLKEIPHSHRKVFLNMVTLMRELTPNNADNKLEEKTRETLATLFGEIFLRTPPEETEKESKLPSVGRRTIGQQRSRKKASFVYQFLINEYDG